MPRNAPRRNINPDDRPDLAAAPEIEGGPPPPDRVPSNGPTPGAVPFMRPSERPREPVTAGSPTGPGPGPRRSANSQVAARNAAIALAAINKLPDASRETRGAFLRARAQARFAAARQGQ